MDDAEFAKRWRPILENFHRSSHFRTPELDPATDDENWKYVLAELQLYGTLSRPKLDAAATDPFELDGVEKVYYDSRALRDIKPSHSPTHIRLLGRLKDGRYFYLYGLVLRAGLADSFVLRHKSGVLFALNKSLFLAALPLLPEKVIEAVKKEPE